MKTGIKTIIENMNMTTQERQKLTEEWLQSEYNIKKIKDPFFARSLTLIHDHDELPLHFGAVKVGTAFSALYVRLVTTPDGWHLATSLTPDGNDVKILHPKNEPASRNPENIIGLQNLIKILTNGSVVDTGEHVNSLPLIQDEERTISLPTENNTDEDILTENITLNDSDKKTTSISIDMTKFMTGE